MQAYFVLLFLHLAHGVRDSLTLDHRRVLRGCKMYFARQLFWHFFRTKKKKILSIQIAKLHEYTYYCTDIVFVRTHT